MSKRSYRQNCALALTADLVGERWSLLLIRDLLTGAKRYKDLHRSLHGMGTNLLAARLKELEDGGIIAKQELEGGGHAYALTDAGQALEPAILALVRWGLSYLPDRDTSFYHQDDWDLVALKAAFDPARAEGIEVRIQFLADSLNSWVDIGERQIDIGIGECDQPDITVEGTVTDLFVTARDPAALLASGSKRKLNRFMSAFAL